MEVTAILSQFELLTGKFPLAAVEAAIERREEITPHLIHILDEVVRVPKKFADNGNYMAHFYALYLLAEFRETAAYPVIVRLAQIPSDLVDNLFGDFVTETLGRVLASVSGGEIAGIQSIIENEMADEWVRGAALDALVTLVVAGERSREEILAYFGRLFQGGLVRKQSAVWEGLISATCDLWPGELLEEIERAYGEGLVDESFMDMGDVEHTLAKGKEASLASTGSNRHFQFMSNTVKDFGSWACFQPQRARADTRTTIGKTKTIPTLSSIERHAPLPSGFSPVWSTIDKTRRNDPCPCGSGKKYKKCCLQ